MEKAQPKCGADLWSKLSCTTSSWQQRGSPWPPWNAAESSSRFATGAGQAQNIDGAQTTRLCIKDKTHNPPWAESETAYLRAMQFSRQHPSLRTAPVNQRTTDGEAQCVDGFQHHNRALLSSA